MHYLHMRERHPIDDLFRRVLNEAETTPPAEVWLAVQRRRSWFRRWAVRAERHRSIAALVLLLLLGGGAGILFRTDAGNGTRMNAGSNEAQPTRTTASPDQRAPLPISPSSDVTAATATDAQEAGDPPERLADEAARSREATLEPPLKAQRIESGGKGVRTLAGPERREVAPLVDTDGSTSTPEPMARINEAFIAATKEGTSGSGVDDPRPQTTLSRIDPRRTTIGHISDSARIAARGGVLEYAMERGNYWFGVQWALHGLDAQWTGSRTLVEELDRAEDWGTQRSMALLFGRRWRSGASVATGAEFVQRTSRFLYDRELPALQTTVLDTVWSGTPSGAATVYTWDIDSTTVLEPGAKQRYSTSNRYVLLRFPVEVGWRKEVRRWSIGGKLGVALTIPLHRKGTTLGMAEEAQDASIGAIDLADPAIADRFGPTLGLTAAFDLGLRFSEHWSIHLGPACSRDIVNEGPAPRPQVSSYGGFFALEHDLPSHERARPSPATTP